MGGGGGKTPAPKTFTPPPLQQGPVSPPIPNFFAGRTGGPSPYQQMAEFVPQATQGPFGSAVNPMRFAPQKGREAPPQREVTAEAVAEALAAPSNNWREAIRANPPSTSMTKSEFQSRLGKGQR